jgi:hypothetical protein
MQAIKEAKQLFEVTIDKMVQAHNYEMKNLSI